MSWNYYIENEAIRGLGISCNQAPYREVVDTEDRKNVRVGFCSSKSCAGVKRMLPVVFRKRADKCPHCGDYLFWKCMSEAEATDLEHEYRVPSSE